MRNFDAIESGRRFAVRGNKLLVKSAQFKDSGLYTCELSNRYGDASATMRLTVHGEDFVNF